MNGKRFLLWLLALTVCIMMTAPAVCATGGYDPDGWTGSHTHRYNGGQVRVEPTCEEDGYIATKCTGCQEIRVDQVLPAMGHSYVWGICQSCDAADPAYVPGDLTGDGTADNEDVVALLWSVLFPEEYPLEAGLDLTGDGGLNNDDVVKLLWHTLFPEQYPL